MCARVCRIAPTVFAAPFLQACPHSIPVGLPPSGSTLASASAPKQTDVAVFLLPLRPQAFSRQPSGIFPRAPATCPRLLRCFARCFFNSSIHVERQPPIACTAKLPPSFVPPSSDWTGCTFRRLTGNEWLRFAASFRAGRLPGLRSCWRPAI